MTICNDDDIDVCDLLQGRIRSRLVYLREKAELSQEYIAKGIGVDADYLEKIEKGEEEITVPLLLKILMLFENILDEN